MKEKTQNAGRGASLAMGVAFVGFTTQFGLIPLVKTGYRLCNADCDCDTVYCPYDCRLREKTAGHGQRSS